MVVYLTMYKAYKGFQISFPILFFHIQYIKKTQLLFNPLEFSTRYQRNSSGVKALVFQTVTLVWSPVEYMFPQIKSQHEALSTTKCGPNQKDKGRKKTVRY